MPNCKQQEYAFVYKTAYAMKMIEKGHQVFSTMPNPKNNRLIVWIFYKDATFQSDFDALIEGGARNG